MNRIIFILGDINASKVNNGHFIKNFMLLLQILAYLNINLAKAILK